MLIFDQEQLHYPPDNITFCTVDSSSGTSFKDNENIVEDSGEDEKLKTHPQKTRAIQHNHHVWNQKKVDETESVKSWWKILMKGIVNYFDLWNTIDILVLILVIIRSCTIIAPPPL